MSGSRTAVLTKPVRSLFLGTSGCARAVVPLEVQHSEMNFTVIGEPAPVDSVCGDRSGSPTLPQSAVRYSRTGRSILRSASTCSELKRIFQRRHRVIEAEIPFRESITGPRTDLDRHECVLTVVKIWLTWMYNLCI